MIASLPEASADEVVRRALLAPNHTIGRAMVFESPDSIDAVRTILREEAIPFCEPELDGALRARREAIEREHPGAVIFSSTSKDPRLWQQVDQHRSHLEGGPTTFFCLSPDAATTMQRSAPHLTSLLGTICIHLDDSDLRAAIARAAIARYPELYEDVDGRPAKNLDKVTSDVLQAFGDPVVNERAWRRLGFMGSHSS
jgi:hypothetical protein